MRFFTINLSYFKVASAIYDMYFSYIGQRVGCVMLCFASLCGPGESIASGRRDKVVCVLFSSWCLVCLLFFASCTLISFFSWCVPVLYWSFLCIYIFFLYSHHFHFLLCNLGYFLFIFRCFYLDLFIFLFFFSFPSTFLPPSISFAVLRYTRCLHSRATCRPP